MRFSIKASPELVGDQYLQSCNTRRRYMRRGSRCPNMLAIDAVRSSVEVAKEEAIDKYEERIEQLRLVGVNHNSLSHVIRRSFSLPKTTSTTPKTASLYVFDAVKGSVEHDLAHSLFQKTKLTVAQKRRLSLQILSRVSAETGSGL